MHLHERGYLVPRLRHSLHALSASLPNRHVGRRVCLVAESAIMVAEQVVTARAAIREPARRRILLEYIALSTEGSVGRTMRVLCSWKT